MFPASRRPICRVPGQYAASKSQIRRDSGVLWLGRQVIEQLSAQISGLKIEVLGTILQKGLPIETYAELDKLAAVAPTPTATTSMSEIIIFNHGIHGNAEFFRFFRC